MLDVATLGRIIRDERKELGLRQDQLAAASGVGLRFIVELERGKPTVQLEKVLAVLQTLGLTIQIMHPDGRVIDRASSSPAKGQP